jgi:hypothetical protein
MGKQTQDEMLLCSNELFVAPMPSRTFVWDPQHWRFRAEETRTVADQMTHEEARTIMRRIAMDYDRLAKLAEVQLADQERRAISDKT